MKTQIQKIFSYAAIIMLQNLIIIFPLVAQETGTVLKPNDYIKVDVFNEPSVSVPQTMINVSGDASIPLLGQVNLAKMTLEQASEKLRKLFQEDLFVDPKVSITILREAEETVSILGSVQNPGQLILRTGGIDLSTAIASAGGLLDTADPNKIELTRVTGEKATYSSVDISSGAAGKIKLKSGDRVIIGQNPLVNKYVTIGGHVSKRGLIAYPLDGKLDIVAAIASAGGLTELASGEILLTRNGKTTTIDYKAITEKGAPTVMLLPGDIIQVKQRWA